MADQVLSQSGARALPQLWKDLGGGAYALTVSIVGGGGGGSSTDRELVIQTYRANKAFTGASTNDLVSATRMMDVSGTTPVQVGDTYWFNETTQLPLSGAPLAADIDLAGGGGGATAAEMTAIMASKATDANITALVGAKTTASTALPAGGSGIIGWLSNLWQSFFGIADGSADSGGSVKVGGVYQSARPSLSSGNRGNLQLTSSGDLSVSLRQGTTTPGADNGGSDGNTSATLGLNTRSFNYVFNGTSWDRRRGDTTGAFTVGNVAHAAADAGNPVKVGGKYNASALTLTDGNRSDLQMSRDGALTVHPAGSANASDGLSNLFSQLGRNRTGIDILPVQGNFFFNGTSWDRMRGDATNGLIVQSAALGAAADAAAASPATTAGLTAILKGFWKFWTDSGGSAVDTLSLSNTYPTTRSVTYFYNTDTSFLSRARGTETRGLLVDPKGAVLVTTLGNPTATGVGGVTAMKSGRKTVQVSGATSGGVGAATVVIQGSLNNSNYDDLATVNLTLGTTSTSDSFTTDDRYLYYRYNVTAISGTGASLTVNVGV